MGGEAVNGSADVAHMVLAVEPYMRELLKLRADNQRLRWDKPTTEFGGKSLAELLEGTPLRLEREDSGKWRFSLDLSADMHTGGGIYETDVEALRAAISHAAHLYAELERGEDIDD